jgi:predicted RNase H-like HicB family nuclease
VRQTVHATVYSDSGGFVAECPDLYAVTQGDTLDETMRNLQEVIALALEDEVREGIAPTAPGSTPA